MAGEIFGVRIIPPVLQFYDTVPHTNSELPITILNVSKTSKNIRCYGPKSELVLSAQKHADCTPNFTLKVKNPETAVAPGLAVSATVGYCPKFEREDRDKVVVTVDGNVVEVPLYGYPCQPMMDFTDNIEFGTVLADSKAVTKEIIITNTGSKKGDFKIKYSGNEHISVIPGSGTVAPHSEQKVKVEFVPSTAGKLNEVAEVYLQGREITKLHICGSVIKRTLELLSTNNNNDKVDCIKFGSTYYGTDKTECAILYNNGTEPASFVAVINDDSIAQEMGVDLTMTTTMALAEEGEDWNRRGCTNEITSLISAIPNQGVLKPYQKLPIFFRFSPRWYGPKQGWKNQVCSPPRKDFALFLKLQIIGSSSGYTDHETRKENARNYNSEVSDSHVEVALTGTALPVLLSIYPTAKLDFGECPVAEHADVLCTIKNESNILPVLFEFKRVAHFTVHPFSGKILPGQAQDVIFSFAPKQVGSFKPEQLMDVLGQAADRINPNIFYTQVIYTLSIKLSGSSKPITIVPKPKFNPGITPYITNEVGLNVETTFKDLKEEQLRNAVAGSTKTKLHHLKGQKKSLIQQRKGSAKVAFPNDRALSIRPFNRKEQYKSLFTHADRYNYTDPDYAFDDGSSQKKAKHGLKYVQQLREQREKRLAKRKIKEFIDANNSTDIGIKAAAGFAPRKLTLDDIMPDPSPSPPPNAEWKILSTKELAQSERTIMSKGICKGLNALPTTDSEKKDCTKWLSPQQLHQVVIGPPVIDFGSVCLRSVCQKELRIINNLAQFVHVVAEIDCAELRQSSPLSQVVPPESQAAIPIIFESSTKGMFQRSVAYMVNSLHKQHVTVQAKVVPVAIELSTSKILLKPTPGMPVEAGFRGVVTLYNKQNYPAEFTWSPDRVEKGTAFSMRPATGVVDPYTNLDCEIVWHPSFLAPDEGSFTLFISGGESRSLMCSAEVGNTNVYFIDARVAFGAAAVNLTTVMSSLLHNSGSNHAYFQVIDTSPLQGITISPAHGVVPVGGSTEIRVSLTPDSIIKFDTKVQVAVRGGKTLELRITGYVESPELKIDVASLNFGGVYCGSSATIPFSVENKAKSKCRLEVDLRRYKDFSVAFPGCQSIEDNTFQLLNPGISSVTLDPEEVIEGEITFTPQQVAAYDFILPVVVNHLGGHTRVLSMHSMSSSSPISQSSSAYHIITPKPVPATVTLPHKQVIATAIRQPLQMSTNRIEFQLPPNYADSFGGLNAKALTFKNVSTENVSWMLDLTIGKDVIDKGIFKFLHEKNAPFVFVADSKCIEGHLGPGESQTILVNFCPFTSGCSQIIVPVVLNSNWDKPFQFLEIVGELIGPKIWFHPQSILLTPAPLQTEVSAEFTLLASNYKKASYISASVPEIECEDGSVISPLKVTFVSGNVIKPFIGFDIQSEPSTLQCKVTFSSERPVSFSQTITFCDDAGSHYSLRVTATADNCILTNYPFLAMHRGDYHVVCEQGSSPKGCRSVGKTKHKSDQESFRSGEAVLVPHPAPDLGNSESGTTTTSSIFQVSSSSYESSSANTDSCSVSESLKEDGKLSPCPECDKNLKFQKRTHSVGTSVLLDEDTEEGVFHMEVLMAMQRWFSFHGWPGGPYPILVPESLRMAISKKTVEMSKSKEDIPSKTRLREKAKIKSVHHKFIKTIYDMMNFLSGKPLPGIPVNATLPANPVERVKQIYWQHCTLLTFLKCQGACLSSVLPEYLMMPEDFVLWRQLQQTVKMELIQQGNARDAEKIKTDDIIEEEVFEAVSRRVWTDVLLQILKVFVLAKITPKTLKSLSIPEKDIFMPSVSADPLSSNVYSIAERVLLAWMNYHYANNLTIIWQECQKGGVPASRWVVNFDYDLMDGLVIASLLGAHMPFLIKSHLEEMYTNPSTAEQCLHNALKVVAAMRYVGIDYDIQAIDITDPNPIVLLMLIVHLYEKLPQYLPKATIEFKGSLQAVVPRQVKVANTSTKNLVYTILLAGRDASDFTVPKGSMITVLAKSTFLLSVEFKSRFLRPAEAVLVLAGRRQGTITGSTLTFNLVTEIDNIKPRSVIRVESPCYELEKIMFDVTNPYLEGGEFRVVIIETKASEVSQSSQSMSKDKKRFQSKFNLLKKKESPSDLISMNKILEHQETMALKNSQIPTLHAFHAATTGIHVECSGTTEVELDFLPFHVGDHQCTVIFLNEKIGEFVYLVDAKALAPLPSYLPYLPDKNSARISTAASGDTSNAGDDNIIYWTCEAGGMVKETLLIPSTNVAKEKALIIAAQQHMSSMEMQRRQVTGTMMSCTVTAKTLKDLSNNPTAAVSLAKAMGPVADVYKVEVDSDYFQVPVMLVMPSPRNSRTKCLQPGTNIQGDVNLADGVAELTVQFRAKDPGTYSAIITLTAIDDVRTYHIECTVVSQGSPTELEFHAPVHQSVTQNIPVTNVTDVNWTFHASISGNWFYGPSSLTVKSYSTASYPLTFRPMIEEDISGKLVLTNKDDGTEKVFSLTGKGEKPLPLDQIVLTCGAKASIVHTVKVPNVTNKKLTYRVESDLPFISGQQTITVLPNHTGSYNAVITPNKRGKFKGILAFIAGKGPAREVDSDGESFPQEDMDSEYHGSWMWYSLEIDVKPPLPERTVTVVCACHKKTLVEVIVRNPTPKEITLKASIRGRDVTGPLSVTLCPGEKDVYTLTFAPNQVGETRGSLIFFNEDVGEFWYSLILIAEPPTPTTLPHLECELGRWTRQEITLCNPTDEAVEVMAKVSNTNNFVMDRDTEKPIILKPNINTSVTFRFVPSALGVGDHVAKIAFMSEQFGEWVFIASGTGLLPKTQPPVITRASVHSNSNFFISFKNPTTEPILADIFVTDAEIDSDKMPSVADVVNQNSPFTMLLKHSTGVHIRPKSFLEIPINFAPSEAKKYQGYCTVVIQREDGHPWPYVPHDVLGTTLSSDTVGIKKIKWVFPLQGMPESIELSEPTSISCLAHDRTEQRLETVLGKGTSGTSRRSSVMIRERTSGVRNPTLPDSFVVGNTRATVEEYKFEVLCDDDEVDNEIQQCLDLSLVRHYMDPSTGHVTLVFNVKFAPSKSMDHQVQLLVKATSGSFWTFPLRLKATEPPVDGTIVIEASGLGKPSTASFRLNLGQKHASEVKAFFDSSSDPEFSVTPEAGEITADDPAGTLFTITFLPNVYGKLYSAKLIVQTSDSQWSYNVKGALPDYQPPRGVSAPPIAGPHPPVKSQSGRKNYVRENLKLLTTAVSSPVKGGHLMQITKAHG